MQHTALVTGSSSGLGLHTAIALARRGFRVYAGVRSLDRCGELDDLAAREGVELRKVVLDITDEKQRSGVLAQIVREAGALDVLVNNAGFGIVGYAEDVSGEELRAQFETNFFATVELSRLVLPHMRERKRGRVITISSLSGRIATPALGAYSASKFALEGWMEALRIEVAPFGIAVSLVEPGAFRTEIFGRNKQLAAGSEDPDSAYAAYTRHFLESVAPKLDRMRGDPRKVGDRVAKVASQRRPAFRYVIGDDARGALLLRAVLPASILEWFYRRFFLPRSNPS